MEALSHSLESLGSFLSSFLGPFAPRLLAALAIQDDGRGFDVQAERPRHFGVGNMRERAAELGAKFLLESGPQGGTQIQIDLSWEAC